MLLKRRYSFGDERLDRLPSFPGLYVQLQEQGFQTRPFSDQDLLPETGILAPDRNERGDGRPPAEYCQHCKHCQQGREQVKKSGSSWFFKPNDALQEKRNKLQTGKKALEDEKKALQKEFDGYRQDVSREKDQASSVEGKLRNEKAQAEYQNIRLNQQVGSLEEELRKLEQRKAKAEEELKRSKAAIKEELEFERKYIRELKAEQQRQAAIISKHQSAAFSKLSDQVSTEFTDDKIREELEEVFKDSQEWAKENYVRRLENINEVKKRLVDLGVLAPEGSMDPHNYFDFNGEIVADTLLEAALNHELCLFFLRNPFSVVSSALRTDENSMEKEVTILQVVTEHIEKYNPEKAIIWRSNTIKLLLETGCNQEQKRLAIYRTIAKLFIQKWNILIHQPVEVEEESFLIDLVVRFVDLASKLWCLKTDIRFHSLQYFGGSVRFHVNSHQMAAAQVVALEESSKRLDGRPIALVVRPKIDASPRVGSRGTNQRIIWAKAAVWVSNRAPPSKMERAYSLLTSITGSAEAMDEDDKEN